MMVLVLSGILVLTIGGCVCVWWAARGGPRWTRAVSAATLAAGGPARPPRPSRRAGWPAARAVTTATRAAETTERPPPGTAGG